MKKLKLCSSPPKGCSVLELFCMNGNEVPVLVPRSFWVPAWKHQNTNLKDHIFILVCLRYFQGLVEFESLYQDLNIYTSVLLASQNPGFSASHKNHGRPVFPSTSPLSWISARLNIFMLWKYLEVLGWKLLHKCKILSLKKTKQKKPNPALPIFRWCIKKKKPPYCHMQDRRSMLLIKTSTNGRLFSNKMGSGGERPAKNPMETHDWLQNCNTDLISFK